jgi:hypothetical protein
MGSLIRVEAVLECERMLGSFVDADVAALSSCFGSNGLESVDPSLH